MVKKTIVVTLTVLGVLATVFIVLPLAFMFIVAVFGG
jgi:hypothetical protein